MSSWNVSKIMYTGVFFAFFFAVVCAKGEAVVIPPISSTFTVTTTSDTFPVGLPGELRWAIQQGNANPPPEGFVNAINFDIPGTGPFVIKPIQDLDPITHPVLIDGYSQPGTQENTDPFESNAVLLIVINGSNYTVGDGLTSGNCLTLQSSSTGSIVRGLVINEWIRDAIRISSPNTFIVGNFIGTNPEGTELLANRQGISLGAPNSTIGIGSGDLSDRNVISGSFDAASALGSCIKVLTSNNTQIKGNLIGTDKNGKKVLGNSQVGIFTEFSEGVVIGGLSSAERNIISGQAMAGIWLAEFTTNSTVQGNFIGTDVTGTKALGNLTSGIFIGGFDKSVMGNLIGGSNPSARNVISGNGSGIIIGATPLDSSDNNRIQGNLIGTDVTGKKKLGNTNDGIRLNGSNNLIGGTLPTERNIISGNGKSGILISSISSGSTSVMGNYIGTDISGEFAIGNRDGVQIGLAGPFGFANDNSIGGSVPGAGNVISGNHRFGVYIQSHSTGNVIQNNILGLNAIGDKALPNQKKNIKIQCSPGNIFEGNIEE